MEAGHEDREKLQQNYDEIRAVGFKALAKRSLWALMAPIIVLGSIYGGIDSPTEAAAMSVLYALFVSMAIYRSVGLRDLCGIFASSVKTYGSLLFIIGGAVAMARVLTMLQAPQVDGTSMMQLATSREALIGLAIVMLLVVGMFMDTIPSLLIFTPIFLPVMVRVGVDPIHFGCIMVVSLALAVGLVTPPMGINLFVASSMLIFAFCVALAAIAYVSQIPLAFIR